MTGRGVAALVGGALLFVGLVLGLLPRHAADGSLCGSLLLAERGENSAACWDARTGLLWPAAITLGAGLVLTLGAATHRPVSPGGQAPA